MYWAALYSWMTCTQLFWLLVCKYQWIALAQGRNERFGWLYCRWEVLKHYGGIHSKKMQEIGLEEDGVK